MRRESVRLSGRVRGIPATAIPPFRVEAWSRRDDVAQLVASASVTASGRFVLLLPWHAVGPRQGRRRIYFRVFDSFHLLVDTQSSLEWHFGEPQHVTITVSPARGGGATPAVHGSVLQAEGGPVADAPVRAFRKRLRHEDALGEARTDASGAYRIRYETTQRTIDGSFDLVVRAYGPKGDVLGQSPVLFRAPTDAQVDVVVGGDAYRGYSEYEQVVHAVTPSLDGVALGDLTDDDLTFLVGDTGEDAARVRDVRDAAVLGSSFGVDAAIVYGLLREGMPSDAGQLSTTPAANLKRALLAAIGAHLIPNALASSIDASVAKVAGGAATTLLGDPQKPAPGALGPLLATTGLPRATQETVVAAFAESAVDPAAVWTKLKTQLDPAVVGQVQQVLQLGAVARNHLPLVQKLTSLVTSAPTRSVADLARYDRTDWAPMLKDIGAPDVVPGATPDEKLANFAATLERTLEEAFPTQALAGRLTKAKPTPADADVLQFFANGADYLVDATDPDKYIAQNPGTLQGIKDPKVLASSLKAWRRLLKVTPRTDEAVALARAGATSAFAIVHMGLGGLTSALGNTLDAQRLATIYGNAQQTYAATLTVFARFSPAVQSPLLPALVSLDPKVLGPEMAKQGLPAFETLFGSLDACACDDCASVHGPAAYLVDLLQFLGPMIAELDAIRPDIALTELSCRNTDTPLPYIDLVNEVLENAVSPPSPPPTSYATTWSADDLLAHPEHINTAAYDVLKSATYPWTLPMDLALEEASVYLAHLGVPRATLLETFESSNTPSDAAAQARLDMTAIDWTLVTTAPTTAAAGTAPVLVVTTNLAQLQGLNVGGSTLTGGARVLLAGQTDPTQNGLYLIAAGPWTRDASVPPQSSVLFHMPPPNEQVWLYVTPPAGATAPPIVARLAVATNVDGVLAQTGLSYDELLDALWTDYVNPGQAITITFPTDASSGIPDCSLLTAFLDPAPDDTFWSRLHRFTRLRRKLGWTSAELDAALRALGATDIAAPTVSALADIEALRASSSVAVTELLSWWAKMDKKPGRDGTPSFYEQIFQNRSGLDPAKLADFSLANVDPGSPAHPWAPDSDAIRGALGITADDFAVLTDPATVSALGLAAPPVTDPALSLANLTLLFRAVSMSRALGLTVTQLVRVLAITGIHPEASPADARRLVAALADVKGARITLEQLDDLLRGVPAPKGALALTDPAALVLLVQIQTGLAKITASLAFAPDPTGDATRKALAAALPPDAPIDDLVAIIAGSTALTIPPAQQQTELQAALAPIVPADLSAIMAGLFTPPPPPAPPLATAARFALVLQPVLRALIRAGSENLVTQALAAQFKLGAGSMRALLLAVKSTRTPPDPKAGRTALDEFVDPDFVGAPPLVIKDPSTGAPDPFWAPLSTTLARVARASALATSFKLTYEELSFSLAPGGPMLFDGSNAALGWLDLNALPLTPQPSGSALFPQWQNEKGIFDFRDRYAVVGAGMFQQLALALSSDPGFWPSLATITGRPSADLQLLAGPKMLGLAFPGDFVKGTTYANLLACLATLRRLGVAADHVQPWAYGAAPSRDDAAAILSAAKARHTPAEWPAVARPLRDALRIRQRDALVAYLLVPLGSTDPDELFTTYFIDVEMSPCMLTSRIKQAIGSTQLFIQSRIMFPEGAANTFTPDQVDEWQQWRGRYRLWEANRLVFLYPENYLLDGSLRDDKTLLFKDLENELNQSPVTSDSVETAVRHYLEKLAPMANLTVVGVYDDTDAQVVHVIAATPGQSPKYYYRTHVGTPYAHWTEWQPVPLEISGNNVVLVVWNRRLHVFWTVAQEQPSSDPRDKTIPIPSADPNAHNGSVGWPETYNEIHLAYSAFKNGKWTPKRVSGTWAAVSSKLDTADISLKAHVEPDDRGAEDAVVLLREPGSGGYLNHVFRFMGYGDETNDGPVTSHDDFPWQDDAGYQFLFCVDADQGPGPYPVMVNLGSMNDLTPFADSPGVFTLTMSRQEDDYNAGFPFFYADDRRTFYGTGRFVLPLLYSTTIEPGTPGQFTANVPYVVVPPNTEGAPLNGEMLVVPAAPGRPVALTPSDPIRTPRKMSTGGILSAPLKPAPLSGAAIPNDPFDWPYYYPRFTFATFQHPYVPDCIGLLERFGVDGLYDWRTQEAAIPSGVALQLHDETNTGTYSFTTVYQPLSWVDQPYPLEQFDFDSDGAYAQYNWELFFHIPFLVASKLSLNQQFLDAQRWLHFIFDPADPTGPAPARFWKMKKFYLDARTTPQPPPTIQELVALLAQGGGPAADQLNAQVAEYLLDPFNPFAIARLRTAAFQKATVMKYIDNLLAWGDYLFRQDTIESINEATLMYVLASELLGPRPESVDPPATPATYYTYKSLPADLGALADPLITLEGYIQSGLTNYGPGLNGGPPQLLYFCVPGNQQLLAYWDTVADRLFKIRHCMNIEGQVQQLPLFEPPIDPGLLVRAAAAGLDLTSVLSDAGAAIAPYRFQTVLQKAVELVAEVRALGQQMLGAMEKRDGEALALIRAQQELDLLTLVRDVKQMAVDDAQDSLDATTKSKAIAAQRQSYYDGLTAAGLIASEQQHLALTAEAHASQQDAASNEQTAAIIQALPQLVLGLTGIGGSPTATVSFGSENIAAMFRAMAASSNADAADSTYEANRALTNAGHERRAQDWAFQSTMAQMDQDQIESQRLAAEVKLAMAQKELDNHDVQIQNATDVRDFLRDKFTNADLYDWMVGQISATYFQCYQFAYDLARRAERAYQYELRDTSTFIRFGYWDGLKQGLLAGDGLYLDLKRMDAAYVENNRRELEITKHVSLVETDPVAFTQLLQNGVCFVQITEDQYDADYPSHYMRRLKSVALTVPCVVGPYVSVNCTLTLVKHSVRLDPATGGLTDSIGTLESIVTSSAQNDAGTFETNLRDDRYLPFEGAGAISLWKLELPADNNAFDLSTVTDVILHVRYTARDGGDAARQRLELNPLPQPPEPTAPPPPRRFFSARHDFSDAFYRFLNPDPSAAVQSLQLDMSEPRFPYHDPAKTLSITGIRVFVIPRVRSAVGDAVNLQATLTDGSGNPIAPVPPPTPPASPPPPNTAVFQASSDLANLATAAFAGAAPGVLTLQVAEAGIPAGLGTPMDGHTRIDPNKVEDVAVICEYSVA